MDFVTAYGVKQIFFIFTCKRRLWKETYRGTSQGDIFQACKLLSEYVGYVQVWTKGAKTLGINFKDTDEKIFQTYYLLNVHLLQT